LVIVLLTPEVAQGSAWVTGITLLDLWIISTPSVLSLRPRGRTDAGWLAGLGIYGVAVAVGQAGAVAGLFASVSATGRIVYAIYAATSLPALALIFISRQATNHIERIASGRDFKSRHFHWHERLELARTKSQQESTTRLLAQCSEMAMYATRDKSTDGVQVNKRIDAVVDKLCESEGLCESEIHELVQNFQSLLQEREISLRS